MIPALLAAAGLAAVAAAILLLRSLGPRFRIARLLSAAPRVSIEEAIRMARAGERRYVAVVGRVTSDEEFPDENDRPLVFRRLRIEVDDRGGRGWRVLRDDRTAVPFAVEERAAAIDVDIDAIGDGLVVIPRASAGRVEDLRTPGIELLGDDLGGLDPDLPARLVVEQVSAVERATVVGVPEVDSSGTGGRMTTGLDRPLIVSMLEPAAAMRLLAGSRRTRVVGAGMLLLAGPALLAAAIVAAIARL